ncbi:MAG: TonB-dependent receptor, partial [Bacteroidia bacterium]|nr:TonB-dependent receptor [Bacteroidia bacterium]
GGALTALSSQLVANSDFMTGAFPAEYGNALSGVFDIFMRNGNNQKYEHTFQLGIIGIDAASEGPISKKNGSSYLFNYRYSTLGLVMPLMPKTTDGVTYQDLSFKLNFPTKKAGTFSFWGIGLMDHSGSTEKRDSALWVYDNDKENQDANQFMASTGLTHKILLNKKSYLKTSLAATVSGIEFATDRLDNAYALNPFSNISTLNSNIVLSSFINTKFNARHTNKSGFVFTEMMYDMQLERVVQPNMPLQTLVNQQGSSSLISAFTNSSYRLTDQVNMNVGVNAQVFTLNGNYTVEPRLGLKWNYMPNQSLGLAYGAHSRLERLNYYFTKDKANGDALYNKDMDFTKANHYVLSHDWSINAYLHLRTELYFQQLYDVPVIADSSYSFLNLQADWFFNHKLENSGKGRNYGMDLSLEKYMSEGYYYMFTASV